MYKVSDASHVREDGREGLSLAGKEREMEAWLEGLGRGKDIGLGCKHRSTLRSNGPWKHGRQYTCCNTPYIILIRAHTCKYLNTYSVFCYVIYTCSAHAIRKKSQNSTLIKPMADNTPKFVTSTMQAHKKLRNWRRQQFFRMIRQ